METNKNKVMRITGQVFGVVLTACLAAVIIALTAKFIMWMF